MYKRCLESQMEKFEERLAFITDQLRDCNLKLNERE